MREVEEHDAGRPAQVDTAAFTVSAIVPNRSGSVHWRGFQAAEGLAAVARRRIWRSAEVASM
jgi:hypothetical protein